MTQRGRNSPAVSEITLSKFVAYIVSAGFTGVQTSDAEASCHDGSLDASRVIRLP